MNTQHANIKFTLEWEKDESLSFLDCAVSRDGDEFVTSVFRKSTFSGVYIHFNSFLPSTYKYNIILALIHRCFELCSSWKNFRIEIVKLKDIFKKNGYPPSFINSCIKKYLKKISVFPRPNKDNMLSNKLLIVLPYLGTISTTSRNRLQKLFKRVLPNYNLRVIFRSTCRINSFLRFKDCVPEHLKSNVIYRFQCRSCNAAYIGQSTRHYYVRVCEHLRISEFTGKIMESKLKTAVSQHMKDCNHSNDEESFKIISRGTSSTTEYSLQVQESILIAKYDPSLNKSVRSVPLLLF